MIFILVFGAKKMFILTYVNYLFVWNYFKLFFQFLGHLGLPTLHMSTVLLIVLLFANHYPDLPIPWLTVLPTIEPAANRNPCCRTHNRPSSFHSWLPFVRLLYKPFPSTLLPTTTRFCLFHHFYFILSYQTLSYSFLLSKSSENSSTWL